MKLLIFTVLFLCLKLSWSQDRYCHRIAHVDVEYVLAEWIEVQKVDSIVYQQKVSAEKSFRPTFDRYQSLYEEVSENRYSGIELENKVLELEQLEVKVNQYNYSLKQSLILKQEQLMKPLFSELKSTIGLLAKRGDYDHVLSSVSSESSILLYSRYSVDDLTGLVLELLHQE